MELLENSIRGTLKKVLTEAKLNGLVRKDSEDSQEVRGSFNCGNRNYRDIAFLKSLYL